MCVCVKDGEAGREGEEIMCAENGGLDIAEQETISHSKGPAEEKEGGRRRRKKGAGGGWNTVMAGWAAHGDECVIHPSLLQAEHHVQDMKGSRLKPGNMSPIITPSR